MRKLVTQFKTILALINCSFEKFKLPPPSMGLKQISPPPWGGLNRGFTVCLQITGSSHLIKIHCAGVSPLTNLSSQIWLGMIPASLEPSVLLAWKETKTTHSIQVFVTFPNRRRICSNSSIGDPLFRLRVLPPNSRSLTSNVVSLRSETRPAHVYASFSQLRNKKVWYARIYLDLSATHQAKAVWELTQHVREMTSEVSKQQRKQQHWIAK